MAEPADHPAPWAPVFAIALTVMVAFGVILYGFSIFVTEEAAGAEFSKTLLSFAYGGSVIAGGVLAIPIGRRADRFGVKTILLVGGVLAGAGMGVFASANQPWQVLAAWWLMIGPAGAMTYYEVAFIAVDQWYPPRQRPRALGILTLVGGLAGIIFIPLTEWLVGELGWRASAWAMGGLVLATAVATATFAIGDDPRPRSHAGGEGVRTMGTRLARDRRFVIHTAAMALTFFAVQGLLAHRIALFDEGGFETGTVALWAAFASALSLPGRWIAPILATRRRAADVQAVATVFLAGGTALMLDGSVTWQMVGHFSLFGLAFGAMLPLRAMAMASWFSGSEYGATMGSQWMVVTMLGATGPAAVGLLRDRSADYATAISLLLAALIASSVLLLVATRVPAAGNQSR